MLARLEAFSRARRRIANMALACRLGGLALGIGSFALLALSGYLPNPFVNLAGFTLVAAALVVLAVRFVLRRQRFRGHLHEAFGMERLAGDLNSRLISALDFSARKRVSPLMEVVLRRAADDLKGDFEARLDRSRRNRLARRAGVLAGVFLALGLTPWFGFARVAGNFRDSLWAARDALFPVLYEVHPPAGRHVHALGSAVPVQIAFASPGFREVTLVEQTGGQTRRHALAVDAAGRAEMVIASKVESEHLLHFEFGRRRSGEVHLIFSDRPVLENMQTELVYPAYTRLLPRNLEGVQERLFALAGTRVTLGFTFSKELAAAKLTWDDGEELPLEVVGRFASTAIVHSRARRAALQVEDVHGFSLAAPLEIDFQLQQDERPQVFLPNTLKKDMPVLAEGLKLFGFGVRCQDDFGLSRCVLKWTRSTVGDPGQQSRPLEVVRVISPVRPKALVTFERVFESIAAEPGDLFTFWIEAYDNRSPTNQMTASEKKSVFVYQQGLEEFQIAKLGFGSGELARERIAKSKRDTGLKMPAGERTAERVWNEYEAKIETMTRPPRITGEHAPSVRDYFRLFSTAVQEGSPAEPAPEPGGTAPPVPEEHRSEE